MLVVMSVMPVISIVAIIVLTVTIVAVRKAIDAVATAMTPVLNRAKLRANGRERLLDHPAVHEHAEAVRRRARG